MRKLIIVFIFCSLAAVSFSQTTVDGWKKKTQPELTKLVQLIEKKVPSITNDSGLIERLYFYKDKYTGTPGYISLIYQPNGRKDLKMLFLSCYFEDPGVNGLEEIKLGDLSTSVVLRMNGSLTVFGGPQKNPEFYFDFIRDLQQMLQKLP